MANLIQALWDFTNDQHTSFYPYHSRFSENKRIHLKQFLFATMDEVRLRHAATYAKHVLPTIDYEDADHFRLGLLR